MVQATQLLAAQNGYYKLVILLSDGDPTPDDQRYPQIDIITDQRVPDAFTKRVMYSTVYLHVPGSPSPADNALLKYIARHTDYITRYHHLSDPPRYYFRVTDSTQVVAAYRGLFNDIGNRSVPQAVHLTEQINGRLLMDPEVQPHFTGDGFERVQNVIGQPLDQSLRQFASSGRFEVHMNELKGEASLSFAVKLDLTTVTDSELAQGYVLLQVDRPFSRINGGLAGAAEWNWFEAR